MYLVDTNVWLEHLLNQTKAQEAKQFLGAFDSSALFVTDFSLHSLCVILGRHKRFTVLDQFVSDLFINGQVGMRTIRAADTRSVSAAMQSQQLDFDDAYQYVIARRDGLTLVSFDADFDHSDLRRKTPAQVLALLPQQ